jgi:hypothetical protein
LQHCLAILHQGSAFCQGLFLNYFIFLEKFLQYNNFHCPYTAIPVYNSAASSRILPTSIKRIFAGFPSIFRALFAFGTMQTS